MNSVFHNNPFIILSRYAGCYVGCLSCTVGHVISLLASQMDTYIYGPSAIFRPYPGHTIFAHNANVLLGVVKNVKSSTNPYS